MIRNIAASWLFAAFLVVVAVVTWRVLDSGRPSCSAGMGAAHSCPHAAALMAPPAPPPPEAAPDVDVDAAPPCDGEHAFAPPAHTCGAGGAAFDEPPPPPPPPPPHTCGAG